MSSVHKSYRDVIVTNNPALFKQGHTDGLAVGQVGIFLNDPKKDQIAVYPPNYSFHKEIVIVQGTPNTPTNLFAAIDNGSSRTKNIKGRNIFKWEGRRAARGQNQIIALGYDGLDTSKTLVAKCEETRSVFVKLSGGPIDQIFHTEGKGYVRQYNIFSGCCDACGNDCANVSAETLADDLVNQVNNDPILALGGDGVVVGDFRGNRLYSAKKIVSAGAISPSSNCREWLLSICDNGDDTALGAVQTQSLEQFSGSTSAPQVVRKSRVGSTSVYQTIYDSTLPAPPTFDNAGIVLVSDCATCPAGYTLYNDDLFVYKVERQDAGTAGALTTLNTDYGISGSGETSARIAYEFGQSTYVIVSTTALTVSGTDLLIPLGKTRNTCVVTTPTVTSWTAGALYNRFNKTYFLTIRDTVCGESRLAELQAAYPSLVISQTSVGTDGCTRKFQTTVASDCVLPGCAPDAPKWIAPDAFEGIAWVAAPGTPGVASVGVIFESKYVDIITGECAFDFWKHDTEPMVIEISQHSQDYNDAPTLCSTEWPVTETQALKLPIGVGSRVREDEKFFKGYDRKYRDINPLVREYQDSILQTDPNKFYDQYTLGFQYKYHEHYFSEQYTDTYLVEVYFPEGQGKEFEAAINAYVVSVGIDLDPVVL